MARGSFRSLIFFILGHGSLRPAGPLDQPVCSGWHGRPCLTPEGPVRVWKSCQARGAQMVDLALPLGYHGTFRRLASVKLIGPQGPDEARLAVQQFTQRFGTSTTTRHVVLPDPPRQVLSSCVDQIDNIPAFRPDQAGRRLTPCR